MGKKKYRRRRPLPPPTGPSGQRFGITIDEVTVGSWCPTPDGSGPAEAVALQLVNDESGASFFMRIKTPAAVDELIASLIRHRDDVWPDYESDYLSVVR